MKKLRIPLVIVLVVAAAQVFNANAQTETVLYNFGSTPADGSSPGGGLVLGGDGNFYGITAQGGTSMSCAGGCGTVFQITPSGSYSNLYSFGSYPNDGAEPNSLVEGNDGNFYGTTIGGGTTIVITNICVKCGQTTNINFVSLGTVFRISPSGSYTSLYSFAASADGQSPNGLVQGSDGNFYGTTSVGGTYGDGTVFRISPSGSYSNLYSFGSSSKDGENPNGGLIEGSDGNFYGTTTYGGANDVADGGFGTVFRISPSGSYKTLYSFGSSSQDGEYPNGGLVQSCNGTFYGTTETGGANDVADGGLGTVFEISPTGSHKTLYSFGSDANDGIIPAAGLVQGSDGNFYGTTWKGGSSVVITNIQLTKTGGPVGLGTVFQINPSGSYSNLYSFGSSAPNGAFPIAGLVQGSDSNFYGTTSKSFNDSNLYTNGTVFKLDLGLASINSHCTFSIGSTNAEFAAAGGSGSVDVIASNGCTWAATSSDPFITIKSGCISSGDGTVE